MERLTKRIGEHVYYTKLDYSKTIPSEYNPNDIGRILQALCAYEDTNHTPEECAAAFEELAAYRAAEHADKWVSVNDRLPETERTVLCCTTNGKAFVARYDFKWDRWRTSGTVDITHWMPLPAPAAEAALKEQEEQK